MARNGILIDYQYCTGCYSCEVACQSEHTLPLGQWGVKVMQNGPWPIKDAEGNETDQYVYDFIPSFTKLCDLCAERTEIGKLPSCVHHCEAACMEYGDMEELSKRLVEQPRSVVFSLD